MNEKIKNLSWLIEFLDIHRDVLVSNSEEGFKARLKLQKAAYLLKRMGVEPFTKYEYSIYIKGPYSPELAKDYYSELEPANEVPKIEPEKLEVLWWFVKHDDRWLEIASSILHILEDYPGIDKEQLLSTLKMSKPWITLEEFDKVYRELEERKLVGNQTVLVSRYGISNQLYT